MGKITGITWTNHTFNPWWGCVPVSEGCAECYARRDSSRYGLDIFGTGKERRFFGEKHWNEPLKWNRDAEKAGEHRRVFCMSMGDLFEQSDDTRIGEARIRTYRIIEATPWLDWLLLTKRPENIEYYVPELWNVGYWPENIWLGYTAENRRRYEERKGFMRNLSARVKFISVEPMLESIDLYDLSGINWVIFGAESGPKRRPCDEEWILGGIAQVHESGKKAFVKQISMDGKVSKNPEEWHPDLRVQEFPND